MVVKKLIAVSRKNPHKPKLWPDPPAHSDQHHYPGVLAVQPRRRRTGLSSAFGLIRRVLLLRLTLLAF